MPSADKLILKFLKAHEAQVLADSSHHCQFHGQIRTNAKCRANELFDFRFKIEIVFLCLSFGLLKTDKISPRLFSSAQLFGFKGNESTSVVASLPRKFYLTDAFFI
jgi:hypothetical protein